MTAAPLDPGTEACRICGGTDLELAARRIRGGIDCPVWQCRNCGMAFLPAPYFDPETVRQQYEGDYAFRPSLLAIKGTKDDPYVKVLDFLAPHLDAEKTEFLEIGAGQGHFLGLVKDRVRKVTAIEFNAGQAEYCRKTFGAEVLSCPVEDLPPDRTFDVVFHFSVLEHVPDPYAFLTAAMARVRPGGVMCIEVPNNRDPVLDLYKVPAYVDTYYRKTHLMNYGEKSLALLFDRLGYKRYRIERLQAYSLSNHFHWADTGTGQPSVDIGYRFVFPADLSGPEPVKADLSAFFARMDAEYRAILMRHGYSDVLAALVHKD